MDAREIDKILRHLVRKAGPKPTPAEIKKGTAKALHYALRAELVHSVEKAAKTAYEGKPQEIKKLEKLIKDIGRLQ